MDKLFFTVTSFVFMVYTGFNIFTSNDPLVTLLGLVGIVLCIGLFSVIDILEDIRSHRR